MAAADSNNNAEEDEANAEADAEAEDRDGELGAAECAECTDREDGAGCLDPSR